MGLREILRPGKGSSDRVVATIDAGEFDEDSHDPTWQASLAMARDHVDDHSHGAAVLDFDEFVEDSNDEAWKASLALARDHVDELERTGRSR